MKKIRRIKLKKEHLIKGGKWMTKQLGKAVTDMRLLNAQEVIKSGIYNRPM